MIGAGPSFWWALWELTKLSWPWIVAFLALVVALVCLLACG